MPDDLQAIQGIGYEQEKLLYDAGIGTFQALSNSTVEELDGICKLPASRRPELAGWLSQAKALAAKKKN